VITFGAFNRKSGDSSSPNLLGFGEKGVVCPDCGAVAIQPTESPESAKRIEYHTSLVRRRLQQKMDENGTLAEQWLEKGITCPNEKCRAFISLGSEGSSCFSVSRHGLEEEGVTCPQCGHLAAEPGEWSMVHISERIQRDEQGIEKDRWVEEGICCWQCNSYLMASPDSDIDPLEIGQEYDRDIYHKFARPEGWTPPIQRTEDRPVEVDDWVVVKRGVSLEVNGKIQDIGGAEGKVKSIKEGEVEIMTITGFASGATRLIRCRIEECQPMIFDTFKNGTPIKVRRGKHKGLKGTVKDFHLGQITVDLENGVTTTVPAERIVRDL